MLSYTGRSQDDPFGILLWQVTFSGATDNLIPESVLEYRCAQLVMPEEDKVAAVASGAQQQTVYNGEPGAVLPEHGPGQDVPLAAVPP